VSPVLFLALLGVAIAAAAHSGSKRAERRAREGYRELVGEDHEPPDDGWQTIRPLAGRWGCLVAALEFVRGLGIALALGAGLYLVAG
jgi:hypothetical protein